MSTTQTVTHAGMSREYIGQVIQLNVSFSPSSAPENFKELETTGRLVGVIDLHTNDGQSVQSSSWVFEQPIGTVQVEWMDSLLAGKSVSKIRTVEVTV